MDVIYYLYFDEIHNVGYIGKTSENRLSRRLYEHNRAASTGKKTKLYNWLRKYIGKYELKCKILSKTLESEIEEIKFISEFKNKGCILKNTTTGGEGIKMGFKHKTTVRKKRSKRLKKEKHWVADKNPFFGKFGDKNHKSKKVYKYDLNGTLIKEYQSGCLAARDLGKQSYNRLISRAIITGEIAYGFLWADSYKNIEPKKRQKNKMSNKDIEYCINEHKRGRSINSLHKELGFSRAQITNKITTNKCLPNIYNQLASPHIYLLHNS